MVRGVVASRCRPLHHTNLRRLSLPEMESCLARGADTRFWMKLLLITQIGIAALWGFRQPQLHGNVITIVHDVCNDAQPEHMSEN